MLVMKKRLIAVGMCVVMAFSMAACGKKKNTAAENIGTVGAETDAEGTDDVETPEENTKAVMTGTDYKAKVTLPDYKAMKVGESVAEVSEEDVKRIDCLLLVSGYFNVDMTNIGQKQGEVSKYDVVNIDYVGTMDGTEFEGGSAQGFNLGIGTGSFIEGFEDGLIGVKTGETVDLNLKFPDEYTPNPDYAGKDVVFKVTVNYINEVTDKFVEDNQSAVIYLMYQYFSSCRGYASAKEYYDEVRHGIKVFNVVSDMFQDIKDQSEIEANEEALQEFIAEQKQPYIEYATTSGMTLEELLPTYFSFSTEAEFDEYITDIYNSYAVMFAISKQENIAITEEEYDRVVQAMVDSSGGQYTSINNFQADYPKQTTVDDMICGKVYYRIADIINVVPDSEIETEADTQAEEQTTTAEAE